MIDLKDVPPKLLEARKKEYKKEVALMGELRSQNTVQILGAVVNPSELIILMEYCDGGDLRTRLDSALEGKIVFDHAKAINILLDIAFGMKYLHNR
jgi:serine/threonine protein kinase